MTNDVIKMYNLGYGTLSIAKELNVHRSTVQKILKKNNISFRRTSPHCHYNIDYFSTYSKESSYWAGFIMADGCIRSDRNDVSIHLSNVDHDHLLKFKQAIEYTGNISRYSSSSRISVAGEWFVRDLKNNYNITKRKSLTAKFPKQIPTEYYNHFIRGIYDGDGGITITTCPTISFSGTADILSNISLIIEDIGVNLKSKNDTPPIQYKGTCGQISYSGKNADKILKWLYKDSTDLTRLNRKYEKYKGYFK